MHRVFGRVFLCTYLCTFIFIVYFLCTSFVVSDFLFLCVHVCFRINRVEDHVENQTSGLNPDNLRSVHGKKLFENSQYLVQTYTQLTDIPGSMKSINILKFGWRTCLLTCLFLCPSQVYPLLGFPLQAISQASERLVREHQAKYAQSSRILQQVGREQDGVRVRAVNTNPELGSGEASDSEPDGFFLPGGRYHKLASVKLRIPMLASTRVREQRCSSTGVFLETFLNVNETLKQKVDSENHETLIVFFFSFFF